MRFIILALATLLTIHCKAQDEVSVLKFFYSLKNIDKTEQFTFNGDVMSVKKRADKLFVIVIQSPTTNEKKTLISVIDITQKNIPPNRMMQVQYKMLRNFKTGKMEAVIMGSMPLANF